MRYKNKSQYTETSDRTIYVIRHPQKQICYVGHCRSDMLLKVYRDHKYGNRSTTKKLCRDLDEQNLRPCLHVIETISCAKTEAYRYVIIWAKILTDAGWIVLNDGNTKAYATNLIEENKRRYDDRKGLGINESMSCQNCSVMYYSRERCKVAGDDIVVENKEKLYPETRVRDREIRIRVSAAEYKKIAENAASCDKNLASYVRDLAMIIPPIVIDQGAVTEHTEMIRTYCYALYDVIDNIRKSGEYVPVYLEEIANNAKVIQKIESQFLMQHRELTDKTKREIAKVIRNELKRSKGGKGG